MDYNKPVIIFFLVVAGVAAYSQLHVNSDEGAVPWRHDLEAARAEAARTHQPIFIDFSASWCGSCRQLARSCWSDPSVVESLSHTIPVHIDVDRHRDLARTFDVRYIPMLVLLDENGAFIRSTSGAMSPKHFVAWVENQ